MNRSDTITAIATGHGGAIAVIRVSGPEAIKICNGIFRSASGKLLSESKGYTLHYGEIIHNGIVLDDVILSLYRSPKSYTGEDMIEISCHGSRYVQQEILNTLTANGARLAEAGEFTVRAFLAGKLDLSQAEGIADMIAATDKAAHTLASNQMRGGYSAEFSSLREELIQLVSLLELELDFGEEDVEFADRTRLNTLTTEILSKINSLKSTFRFGNAIKEGIGVAIAGSPNVGKSTLLNALLKEDRAMVSDIAGTTRDVIEDSINIEGIKFRFIDTAGIRRTDDNLEQMGIARTHDSIRKADIILILTEASEDHGSMVDPILKTLSSITITDGQKIYAVINKTDKLPENAALNTVKIQECINKALGGTKVINAVIALSAKESYNIDALTSLLITDIDPSYLYSGNTIIANTRHFEALEKAGCALTRTLEGLSSELPIDLISHDIREAIYHIGSVTGEITNDEILGSIFSKFCIGK